MNEFLFIEINFRSGDKIVQFCCNLIVMQMCKKDRKERVRSLGELRAPLQASQQNEFLLETTPPKASGNTCG